MPRIKQDHAMKPLTQPDSFHAADIRIGTLLHAERNETAIKTAFVLHIDFGEELGVLKSSAQITAHYTAESLIGRQVAAVVNFPPRQIGKMRSQCLVLGAVESGGGVVLLAPDRPVANGTPVG